MVCDHRLSSRHRRVVKMERRWSDCDCGRAVMMERDDGFCLAESLPFRVSGPAKSLSEKERRILPPPSLVTQNSLGVVGWPPTCTSCPRQASLIPDSLRSSLPPSMLLRFLPSFFGREEEKQGVRREGGEGEQCDAPRGRGREQRP